MMTPRGANIGLISSAAGAAAGGDASAQVDEAIDLPPPRSKGGKPLMEALRSRRSIRQYAPRPLPSQVLSDLLWAAFGINRSATAPYWRHVMLIDIYAAMAEAVWLYEPKRYFAPRSTTVSSPER